MLPFVVILALMNEPSSYGELINRLTGLSIELTCMKVVKLLCKFI